MRRPLEKGVSGWEVIAAVSRPRPERLLKDLREQALRRLYVAARKVLQASGSSSSTGQIREGIEMKRMLVVVSIATVALTAAGIAVANGIEGAKHVKEVAGTFTATTASSVQSRTCTTSDGKTIVITDGTYTGTAAGDPDLAGPAKIKARSIVNSTDGIGVVSGKISIDVESGQNTEARFDAVLKGTQLAGFATGRAHDPSAKLLANVSSDFNATTGFANGKIGGTTGGTAAELGPGTCAHSDNDRETSHANGT